MSDRQLIDLWIEVGTTCNLRCSFCYNNMQTGSDNGHAAGGSLNKLAQLLSFFNSYFQVENVLLAGGEVLLDKQWPAMVKMVRELQVSCTILTNGTRLSTENVAELKRLSVDMVQVSVHGATPRTHDRIVRRSGAFEDLHRGLMRLKDQSIPVGFSYVWLDQPIEDIMGVADWASVCDAAYLILGRHRQAYTAQSESQRMVDISQFLDLMVRVGQRCEEYKVPLIVSGYIPSSASNILRSSKSPRVNVDLSGNMRFCLTSPETLGNIFSPTGLQLARKLVGGELVASDRDCACLADATAWKNYLQIDQPPPTRAHA